MGWLINNRKLVLMVLWKLESPSKRPAASVSGEVLSWVLGGIFLPCLTWGEGVRGLKGLL